jgi:hypothetical protein
MRIPKEDDVDLVAIAKALERAGNAHDVEAVLSLCADDVVVRVGSKPPASAFIVGKEQFRSHLQAMLPGFHNESWDYQAAENKVSYKNRYSSDRLRSLGLNRVESTLELVFEGKKIQSWNQYLDSKTIEKMWDLSQE